MKARYVLLTLAVMVAVIVISIKLATAFLVIGGIVALIGLGAACSAVLSLRPSKTHCTDDNSPLINALFGEEK